MDTSIQAINPDDILILPDGSMRYRKDVDEACQPSASVVAVGTMHYAGFAEAMTQEATSIETSEREASHV